MLTWFKPYLKAVGGFAAAVLTNVFTDLVVNHHPYPATWGDALRWFLSIVGTTWLVYQLPYLPKKPAVPALDASKIKTGLAPVPPAPVPPPPPVQPTPGLGGPVLPEHHGEHEKPDG